MEEIQNPNFILEKTKSRVLDIMTKIPEKS